MDNKLSKHFNALSLIKFTGPTVIMMVFLSFYTMIDGMFISKFVSAEALSALNISLPFLTIPVAIAIMLATGSNALIAIKMGENDYQKAREQFSLIIWVGFILGIIFTFIFYVFAEKIAIISGATEKLLPHSIAYIKTLALFSVPLIFQIYAQYFLVTAGKPNLGMITTVLGGIANVIFDYIFIVVFKMGIIGAAIGTGISYSIPAIWGLIIFLTDRNGTLYITKFKNDGKFILDVCFNGSSEMVSNLAFSVTTFLFNISMLKYAGENGVAAITIMLYAQYLLMSVYLGYSSGVCPVISYNYGEKNNDELKNIFKLSMLFIIFSSIAVFILSFVLKDYIIELFVERGTEVFKITKDGYLTFSLCYLFMGINIFTSSLFTALSNGKISAVLSFLRTFVFISAGIIIFPIFWEIDGIWAAVPISEAIATCLCVFCIIKFRHHYNYY